MDSRTIQENDSDAVDVSNPKTYADPRCQRCWGKGTVMIILPGNENIKGVTDKPQLCNCSLTYLIEHPDKAFKFLTSQVS